MEAQNEFNLANVRQSIKEIVKELSNLLRHSEKKRDAIFQNIQTHHANDYTIIMFDLEDYSQAMDALCCCC
jgi:hypothetical protein